MPELEWRLRQTALGRLHFDRNGDYASVAKKTDSASAIMAITPFLLVEDYFSADTQGPPPSKKKAFV